jgi:hypothetical protein
VIESEAFSLFIQRIASECNIALQPKFSPVPPLRHLFDCISLIVSLDRAAVIVHPRGNG